MGTLKLDKKIEVDEAHQAISRLDAAGTVLWVKEQFGGADAGRVMMTSSFGAQAAVMLHLVTQQLPGIPVVFIDTGYLFEQTYQFAKALTRQLNLNVQYYQPKMSAAYLEAIHGKLWEQGSEGLAQYHRICKVEPMQRALEELGPHAWLAGLRREQTQHRANLKHIELQDGVYKIYPILNWSTRDVHAYLKAFDLPYHPLYEQGYVSIGDTHSTRPIGAHEDERAGRFHGLKQECGIHLPQTAEENESRDSSGL